MDANRNELLGALASDAGLERADFLVSSTDQLKRFLDANRDRIAEIGGLTLIDEDPDFLSIAPDLTFRSRTRFLDEATGEWVSETEIIETAAELVELYNPAELYAAFAEAARAEAGLAPEPTGAEDLLDVAHVQPSDAVGFDDAYAAAADQWAAGTEAGPEPTDEEGAAQRLYDLALTFQERSQRSEAGLLDDFAEVSARMSAILGDVTVIDDDDERLILKSGAGFRAEVVPDDGTGEWRNLQSSDDLVEFYDPTDVFGDLADALAEAFPSVAPDFEAVEEDDGAPVAAEDAEPPADPDGLGGSTRA
jgi:hypothetical protein